MRNQYEGDAPRVLFVCSAGLLRSPTAAVVAEREFGWNTRSAGAFEYALIPVTAPLLMWADRIFCMKNEHRTELDRRFSGFRLLERCEILNIEDSYSRMDKELQAMIINRLREAT